MRTSTKSPIHILGLGNLGKLFAYALASSHPSPPQVTLLFHRPELAVQWDKVGRYINVATEGASNARAGFQTEETFGEESGLIRHLIVATKTYATVPALMPISHRLNERSTILFLQNGMGTIEEVTDALFASPSSRPQFLAGIVSHGVYNNGPFSVVHAGMGKVAIGEVVSFREPEDPSAGTRSAVRPSKYMLHCLSAAPVLSASITQPADLLQVRLEKLAINAVINPLTVIFDCFNGELFNRPPIRLLIRALLTEISSVLLSIIAPSTAALVSTASVEARFSPQALENTVEEAAVKTAQNISSMLQDVRDGKMTEIDYINGYIIKRGTERGIDCRLNRTLMRMVQETHVISMSQVPAIFY